MGFCAPIIQPAGCLVGAQDLVGTTALERAMGGWEPGAPWVGRVGVGVLYTFSSLCLRA